MRTCGRLSNCAFVRTTFPFFLFLVPCQTIQPARFQGESRKNDDPRFFRLVSTAQRAHITTHATRLCGWPRVRKSGGDKGGGFRSGAFGASGGVSHA